MKRNRWEIFPKNYSLGLKVILMVTFGGIAFMFQSIEISHAVAAVVMVTVCWIFNLDKEVV